MIDNKTQNVEPLSKNQISKLLNEMRSKTKANKPRYKSGVEMATIFKLSVILLLRASDALKLKYNDIYSRNGFVLDHIRTKDKKTGKVNILQLSDCQSTLYQYRKYLVKNHISSQWLFPAPTNHNKHISRDYYYQFLKRVAKRVHLANVGTHSARKSGAKFVYDDTGGNIGLVMSLLNQSSQRVTELYLGIKGKPEHNAIDDLGKNFDNL